MNTEWSRNLRRRLPDGLALKARCRWPRAFSQSSLIFPISYHQQWHWTGLLFKISLSLLFGCINADFFTRIILFTISSMRSACSCMQISESSLQLWRWKETKIDLEKATDRALQVDRSLKWVYVIISFSSLFFARIGRTILPKNSRRSGLYNNYTIIFTNKSSNSPDRASLEEKLYTE